MQLPPAVIVHSLGDARAALAPGLKVTLLSAPGAGLYAGAGWWHALMAACATSRTGDQGPPDILDCADAPGRALEALRHGQRMLVLHAPDVFADIAERAARLGAILLSAAPPSLDLGARGAERQLVQWLSASAGHAVGWATPNQVGDAGSHE